MTDDPKRLFENAISRTARRWLLTGVVSLFIGVMMGWLTFYSMGVLPRWAGRLMGSVLIFAGILFVYKGFLYSFNRLCPLRRLLFHAPDQVVWVYPLHQPQQTEIKGDTFETTLMIGTARGRRYAVIIPLSRYTLFSDWISDRCGPVVVGYSALREKQFTNDPCGLK
ncbi:hypothetical protein KKF84_01965 [Myxococcota bacterium]|nr:hypothetical protein [Myxococcota bacterium]